MPRHHSKHVTQISSSIRLLTTSQAWPLAGKSHQLIHTVPERPPLSTAVLVAENALVALRHPHTFLSKSSLLLSLINKEPDTPGEQNWVEDLVSSPHMVSSLKPPSQTHAAWVKRQAGSFSPSSSPAAVSTFWPPHPYLLLVSSS